MKYEQKKKIKLSLYEKGFTISFIMRMVKKIVSVLH